MAAGEGVFWLGAVEEPRESLHREGCWREKTVHRVGGGVGSCDEERAWDHPRPVTSRTSPGGMVGVDTARCGCDVGRS